VFGVLYLYGFLRLGFNGNICMQFWVLSGLVIDLKRQGCCKVLTLSVGSCKCTKNVMVEIQG
jgi:hypothetical protein